jgi:ribonuclease HII
VTTFDIGHRAEAAAATFLERKGCTIIAQNWRTRWCEIDIVAERDHNIFFCEVKYRSTNIHGAGLDYVTPKKLQQMRFAAALWVADHGWAGGTELCAIEVSGPRFRITGAVTNL